MSRQDSTDCPKTPVERRTSSPARRAGTLTAVTTLAALTATGAALAVPSSFPDATAGLSALSSSDSAEPSFDAASALSARQAAVAMSSSRSATREAAPKKPKPKPKPKVVGKRYSRVGLNVRKAADADAKVVGTLDVADRVRITDVTDDGWRMIVFEGKHRWVKGTFLTKSKPEPPPAPKAASSTSSSRSSSGSRSSSSSSSRSSSGGISTAPCASGSGVESGIGANATAVHRAVCARYPQVTSYGGYRAGSGNHAAGRALDIMISGSTGTEIAAWLRSNAGKLGITEIIYAQRIWTTQRSSEGWRAMSDRGSVTANHYDHVHVSVR